MTMLDNTAKYSPPRTPIRVRLSRQNDRISFSVAGAGPGIDQADLSSVFAPFFRAESARMKGSNGLGLSIAARIASAFGGRITVSSTPGEGATFSVNLPKSDV
jgi:signal transduction histidine kinase